MLGVGTCRLFSSPMLRRGTRGAQKPIRYSEPHGRFPRVTRACQTSLTAKETSSKVRFAWLPALSLCDSSVLVNAHTKLALIVRWAVRVSASADARYHKDTDSVRIAGELAPESLRLLKS